MKNCVYRGHTIYKFGTISLVVEIRGVENGDLAVSINNISVYSTSS